MSFGNPLEKSIDQLSQKMDDFKNQRKLADLDLEKRILVLENNIKSVQRLLGNIKDFDATKDALLQIDEIQKSLRAMEDTNLIERLEGVQSGERLALLEESTKELKSKISLLSDAIDILGELKPAASAQSGEIPDKKEMLAIMSEMDSVKGAMSKLAASIVPAQRISDVEAAAAKLQDSFTSLIGEFRVLAETVRERIERMDRRLEQEKNIEAPEYLLRDIRTIQAEMQQLRSVNSHIIEQMELGANKIAELKSRREGNGDYSGLVDDLEAMRKSFISLRKEMDLDRAMYPENFMKLEREIAALKGAKGSGTASADVKAMAADLVLFANELKKIKEQLPKYEQIDNIKATEGELVNLVEANTRKMHELTKEIQSVKNSHAMQAVSEVSAKVAGDVDALRKELDISKKSLSELAGMFDMVVASAGKQADGKSIQEKTSQEMEFLRKEMDSSKKAISELTQIFENSMATFKKGANVKAVPETSQEIVAIREELEASKRSIVELSGMLKKVAAASAGGARNKADSTEKIRDEMETELNPLRADIDKSHDAIAELAEMFRKSVRSAEESSAKLAAEDEKAMQALKDTSEMDALKARIKSLEDELIEFKSVARSLIDESGRLAEGLKETSYELSDMRQKQPIIID